MTGHEFNHGSFPVSSNGVPDDCYPSVLKYINNMLMEEDLEDKSCMLQDNLALRAAEKSFYDVLRQKYPTSAHHFPSCSDQNIESQDQNFTPTTLVDSCNTGSSNLAESSWIWGQVELESSPLPSSDTYSPQNTSIIPNLYREIQPFCRVSGVVQSASNSCLLSHSAVFSVMNEPSRPPELELEKDGRYDSSNWTRGRRNRLCTNSSYLDEGRSNKLSLFSESEQLELLDDEYLQKKFNNDSTPCPLYDQRRNVASRKIQQNEELQAPNLRMKRLAHNTQTDLWTLLIQCAQAAGTGDQTTASELLKMIRIHSSPIGDANQRLAHYFANGLEARLNGTGMLYARPIVGRSITSAEILKALQLYVSILPFRRMTNRYANRVIAKLAGKATRIHIIDFGIGYGFQWPCFIHRLSTRSNGPPKIRITGIELPQPGFRPAERVQETGRRLKRVADSFNVPFEYNAIAQKWETIRYEDLKIDRDNEVIVVNCMYRLKNLPDDTMSPNSPRDAVLKLIKRINPDVFLHGVRNGSFNAPFFVTRFREALFHYSGLFDMFEANATPENQERMVFERDIIGREAINVIACEGIERVERPETYKQWQSRNLRIGFRQLPLDQDLFKGVKSFKSDYHKDFDIDEDGHWLLMGWKGRIIHAIAAWKTLSK